MRLSSSERRRIAGSVAIPYARESSVRDAHKVSIDIQKDEIVEAAEENDVALGEWIVDSDKTGRNFDRDIMKAIQAVERGEAQHIYVMNLTRFGRDLLECLQYCKQLNDNDHLLISADPDEGVIDVRTREGRKKAREAFGEAEGFADKIGANWQKAIKLRTKKGLTHGNTERWGYKWCLNESCKRVEQCDDCIEKQSDHFCKKCPPRPRCKDCRHAPQVPDPELAPVVAETIRRFLAGENGGRIVRDLNARGYRTPRAGDPWTTSALYALIDRGFYAGLIRKVNPEPPKGVTKSQAAQIDSGYYIYEKGAQEALITPEEWKQWVEIRCKRVRYEDHNKPRYAESTLMLCECGDKMTAKNPDSSASARWNCRSVQSGVCDHTNANRRLVSEVVLEWVQSLATSNVLVELERSTRAYLKAINAQPLEKLEKFEREQVSLTAEYENLQRNFNRNLLDEEFFVKEKGRLTKEISEIEGQLRLLKPKDLPTFPPREFFTDMLSRWDELDHNLKRAALSRIIWRIEAKKGDWEDKARYRVIPLWEAQMLGLNVKLKQRIKAAL